jgi:thymidylate synthase (FAD)
MGHCLVPEAEAILDKEFPVLDKGFVRLVDYLGSDERIVQSARVSYAGGTKTYRKDRGLIDYLMRNGHTSPFEQVNLTFHVKMPIFVARQWIRHRTAKLNEISGRYSVMSDECYIPTGDVIAFQSEDNKQGRMAQPVSEELQERVRQLLREDQERAYHTYEELLDLNIARELARVNLPLSLYTQWYWQMDLHNLFHFLALRMHAHAQFEIRAYADQIYELTRLVCPMACDAFSAHMLHGQRFSRSELDAIRGMIAGGDNPLTGRAREILDEKLGS